MKKKELIGFIGLGIMGKPMAINLLKAGYPLMVHDLNSKPVEELVNMGAQNGLSPKNIAKDCYLIITMLPNSPEVEAVILGVNGIINSVKQGSIVIDMSSIDPMVSKKLGKRLSEKKVDMLDAPVSGGEPKAIDGSLAIMVGGPKKIFLKVKEILLSMGSSAVLIGEIGSGNVAKLANQIIVAANIAGISEAMVFAMKAGVDPEKIYHAIKGGLAGSTVLDAKMPLILKGNFNPGFKIKLHIKDLLNALKTAKEIKSPMILLPEIIELMKKLESEGKANCDHCGLIQYYEKLANIEVRTGSK
jgi:2-hydroxy-3-oxopropionate reductase